MTRWHGKRRQRGQGLVEFSIALPCMLLILLGTIDMGRMFFDYIDMRNAAVEGATYGSRKPTDTAGIYAAVASHGVPADTAISVATGGSCNTPGGVGDVTVSASRVWTPITLGALNAIGAGVSWSFTINASSTMRCLT